MGRVEYLSVYRAEHKEEKREANLRLRYNLTPAEKEVMWLAQGKRCAICRRRIALHGRCELCAYVDHNHRDKVVRGLLCNKCNRGMGLLGDTLEEAQRVVEYLKKNTA